MSKKIVIPAAIEICSDDEGWFNGSDDRYEGRPSRTGMTRKHCAEDYIALNETGKAIGMKIMCPFVIGEWDRWNLLRNETGMTYEPKTWDRASKIDLKEAERCFEAIESSEFIELAHHGVHGVRRGLAPHPLALSGHRLELAGEVVLHEVLYGCVALV